MAQEDVGGEIDRTTEALRGGVQRLGIAAALPIITGWEERLAVSGVPELAAVAETLRELKGQLQPEGIVDPASVGALLTSLGDQVRTAADAETAARVSENLSKLSAALGDGGASLSEGLKL